MAKDLALIPEEDFVDKFYDQEITRRTLLRQPAKHVSRAMKIPHSQVLARLQDPELKRMLTRAKEQGVASLEKELQEHVRDLRLTLQLSVDEMLEIIMSIARNPNSRDSDRLSAATEIIDRARVLDKAHAATPQAPTNIFNFSAEVINMVQSVNDELSTGQTQVMKSRLLDADRQSARDDTNS